MFGNRNHEQQTKTYLTAFATLFNDIRINPYVPTGTPSKEMTVPIAHGPKEKWLSILRQDPDKEAPAVILPRMGFEIVGFTYNPEKVLQGSVQRHQVGRKMFFAPAPYRMDINLTILAKYYEDLFDIVEQIVPYFRPSLTIKVRVMGDENSSRSMEVNLNSVSPEPEYEGSMDERRILIFTLSFTVEVPFFISNSSQPEAKLIKKATANFLTLNGDKFETGTAYPGMTADGEPTTDPALTIPYQDINKEDNHDIIIEFED